MRAQLIRSETAMFKCMYVWKYTCVCMYLCRLYSMDNAFVEYHMVCILDA